MDRNGFLGFVKNAVRRLAESGAKLIVLFNCHGGNTPYLQIAARECRYELDVTPVLFDVYAGDTAAKFSGPLDYHAGTFETSLMHALVPGAVRSGDSITEVWLVDPRKEAMGATGYPWSSSDFSDTGMIGDPSSADAEIGRQIVGELVVEIITALKTYIGL